MADSEGQKPQPIVPKIRTMRDDLQDAQRKQPAQGKPTFRPPLPPPPVPSPQAIGQVQERSSKILQQPLEPSAITPLAPKLPTTLEGFRPLPVKKKRDPVLLVLMVVFVIAGLSAAGVWAWIYFQPEVSTENIPDADQAPKTLSEVIPANSLLVAHYKLASSEDRTMLQQAWADGGEDTPTIQQTLSGDIRSLLAEAGIDEFMYVLLPGDPRFYLVLDGTQADQYLAQHTSVQVLPISQWRVIHSFDTSLFEQSLASGSFTTAGKSLVQTPGSPLTLHLQSDLILQANDKASLLMGAATEVQLGLSFEEGAAGIVRFVMGGDQATPTPADVSSLLSKLPADTTFIRFGEDFSQQVSRVTDPAAAQFITALSGQYAYYERLGNDGIRDAGVMIQIPPEVAATVALPNPVIEATLPILLSVAELGDTPASELAFIDTVYNGVPLRYTNIRSHTLALDYALFDGFLALASSKESMLALIDRAKGVLPDTTSLTTTDWGALEIASRNLGGNKAFGILLQPAIKRLLPGGEQTNGLPVAVTYNGSQDSPAAAGVLLLPSQQNQ